MRLTITTAGSRGDLQPYLALSLGLKAAGYAVRVATHPPYEESVRSRGLDFHPVSGDPYGDMRRLLRDGGSRIRFVRRNRRNLAETIERTLADYRDACRDAGAVIYGPAGLLGYEVARGMGLPAVGAFVDPLSRTRRFRNPFTPNLPGRLQGGELHGVYNYLSHLIVEQVSWQAVRTPVNRALTEAGLEPVPLRGRLGGLYEDRAPILYGFSPSVLPRPSDWGSHLCAVGYWFLDRARDWRPPQGLVDFLESGPAPVGIGFGSMVDPRPEQLTETVVGALRKAGRRGVLVRGWGDMGAGDLPEEVFTVDEVPYDWLFGRVTAVVHHAGAGTTADSLRAGLPAVTVPFFHNQPFWADRVHQLGAGPAPIPRKNLSSGRLAAAIREAVDDTGMRKRARRLGENIRAEDGVGRAVESFGRYLRA